jgi:hypothetical protein
VLTALEIAEEDPQQPYIRNAVAYLQQMQNQDGGWGESNDSYYPPRHHRPFPSTAFQTAWSLLALLAAAASLASGSDHTPTGQAIPRDNAHARDDFSSIARLSPAAHVWRALRSGLRGQPLRSDRLERQGTSDLTSLPKAVREAMEPLQKKSSSWPQLFTGASGLFDCLVALCGRGSAVWKATRSSSPSGCIYPHMQGMMQVLEGIYEEQASSEDEVLAGGTAVAAPVFSKAPEKRSPAATGAGASDDGQVGPISAANKLPAPEADLRPFTSMLGRTALPHGAVLTAAALPVHRFSLPHPEAVRGAMGLRSDVRSATSNFTHMPSPAAHATMFVHRQSVYLVGGQTQALPSEGLHKSFADVVGPEIMTRAQQMGYLPNECLKKLGITCMEHLFTANLTPVPILSILQQCVPALPALRPDERRCVQDAILSAQGTRGVRNGRLVGAGGDGLAELLYVLQSACDIAAASPMRARPVCSMYRLAQFGSNFKYHSLMMDSDLNDKHRAKLQTLASRSRGHGQAAEWVRVKKWREVSLLIFLFYIRKIIVLLK